jgi:hypothetical protein
MTVRNASTSISKQSFCDTFGVSEAQMERHFQAGMPHEKKGRRVFIPMPAGRVWYHSFLVNKGKKQAAPKNIDEAKLRKETALAEMAELDLAERQRETMKVADHERLLADAYSRVAAKLTGFAARASVASFGAATAEEAEERIEPVVDEIREELRKTDDIPVDDETEDMEEDDGDGDD